MAKKIYLRDSDRIYSKEASICGGTNAQGRQLELLREGSRPIKLYIQDHLDVVEAGRSERYSVDKTGRNTGGALGHTQPFVKSVGGAGSSQGDSIRVNDELNNRREKVEYREN